MTPYLTDIQRCLQQGFYADNFRTIAALAREATKSADNPLSFFIIWRIFDSLDLTWHERPLTENTATRMEKHLRPAFEAYINAAQGGISPELESEYLNEIVRAFLSWLDVQSKIRWGQ